MSNGIFVKNDPGWEKFTATGSIFDYLNYKNNAVIHSNCFDKEVDMGKGESCEARDKRDSG